MKKIQWKIYRVAASKNKNPLLQFIAWLQQPHRKRQKLQLIIQTAIIILIIITLIHQKILIRLLILTIINYKDLISLKPFTRNKIHINRKIINHQKGYILIIKTTHYSLKNIIMGVQRISNRCYMIIKYMNLIKGNWHLIILM